MKQYVPLGAEGKILVVGWKCIARLPELLSLGRNGSVEMLV